MFFVIGHISFEISHLSLPEQFYVMASNAENGKWFMANDI